MADDSCQIRMAEMVRKWERRSAEDEELKEHRRRMGEESIESPETFQELGSMVRYGKSRRHREGLTFVRGRESRLGGSDQWY